MADRLGYRVGVDASGICNNFKSHFFIYVNLLCDRTINDVKDRIKVFLHVDKPISLMIGDFYLPSSENVRLLSADDVLKVVEQDSECINDIDTINHQSANHDEVYLKKCKKDKKRKRSISVESHHDTVKKQIGCSFQKDMCETESVNGNNLDTSAVCLKKQEKKKAKNSRNQLLEEWCVVEKVKSGELFDVSSLVKEKKTKKNESKMKGKSLKGEEDENCRQLLEEQGITEKSKSVELFDVQCSVKEKRSKGTGSRKKDKSLNEEDLENSSLRTVGKTDETKIESEEVNMEGTETGLNSMTDELLLNTTQSNDSYIKKRRKRIRRHKKNRPSVNDKPEVNTSACVKIPSSEPYVRTVVPARTHIRFPEPGGDVSDEDDGTVLANNAETCETASTHHPVVECSDSHISLDLCPSKVNEHENEEKVNLSLQEHVTTKWDVQTSDSSKPEGLLCNGDPFAKLLAFNNFSTPLVYRRNKSTTFEGNAEGEITPIQASSPKVGSIEQDIEQAKDKDEKKINFSQFPLLLGTPGKTDIIAFKMLKMGEDYTPQISDYITAKVISVCMNTFQMTLQVLGGHDQCQQPKGKFDLENDSDVESCTVDTLQMNWNELIETRLVYP